jgi:hypothetical protein
MKITAYANQIVEFDEREAREILQWYCRSKTNESNAPSAFQLRKAIIDRREQWAKENDTQEHVKQLKLDEPRKPPEEIKSLVAGLVEKLK